MTKSKEYEGVWHVKLKGTRNMDAGFLWGNRNEEGHLENLGVDGRVRGRVVSQFG